MNACSRPARSDRARQEQDGAEVEQVEHDQLRPDRDLALLDGRAVPEGVRRQQARRLQRSRPGLAATNSTVSRVGASWMYGANQRSCASDSRTPLVGRCSFWRLTPPLDASSAGCPATCALRSGTSPTIRPATRAAARRAGARPPPRESPARRSPHQRIAPTNGTYSSVGPRVTIASPSSRPASTKIAESALVEAAHQHQQQRRQDHEVDRLRDQAVRHPLQVPRPRAARTAPNVASAAAMPNRRRARK